MLCHKHRTVYSCSNLIMLKLVARTTNFQHSDSDKYSGIIFICRNFHEFVWYAFATSCLHELVPLASISETEKNYDGHETTKTIRIGYRTPLKTIEQDQRITITNYPQRPNQKINYV